MKACHADLRGTTRKSSKFSARMTGGGATGCSVALARALLAGCAGRSQPPASGSRRAIEAAVDRYVAASNRGDAEALAALYEDDAMLLPPDHEPINGRRAISEFWRQGTDEGLEVTTLPWKSMAISAISLGDIIFRRRTRSRPTPGST